VKNLHLIRQPLHITHHASRITYHVSRITLLFLLLQPFLAHAQEITPPPTSTICFFAYDDIDQDGQQDPGEAIKAGVNFVVSSQGVVLLDYDTDGSEPLCLAGLIPGPYLVTHMVIPGEIATGQREHSLILAANDTIELAFGSFNPPTTSTPTAPATGTPLPTLVPAGPTPTPDSEGIIYAEVFPNDSLSSVAARAGITLAQLLELNGLTQTSLIHPGDQLIVGFAPAPATATPEPVTPTSTPTRPPPTATNTAVPFPLAALCLIAFDDANQNSTYEAGEELKAAVAFTIFNENAVVGNLISDDLSESQCLDLEPGTYQVTRSIRPGETLTTEGNGIVILGRGDVVQLAFGSITAPPPPGIQPITSNEDAPTAVPSNAGATLPPTNSPLPPSRTFTPSLIGGIILALLLASGLVVWLIGNKDNH
jgi:LysM repeat protein